MMQYDVFAKFSMFVMKLQRLRLQALQIASCEIHYVSRLSTVCTKYTSAGNKKADSSYR